MKVPDYTILMGDQVIADWPHQLVTGDIGNFTRPPKPEVAPRPTFVTSKVF